MFDWGISRLFIRVQIFIGAELADDPEFKRRVATGQFQEDYVLERNYHLLNAKIIKLFSY